MERDNFISAKLSEFPKGWSVKVRPIRPYKNVSLSRTALHEAKHLVLLHANGTGAKSGTIEPGPGYLGMVEPNGFDAIAALGPDADGDPGSEHDRGVAARGGADISSARKIARSMLDKLREEVRIVAGLLETERTVTGSRVDTVITKATEDPDEELEITEPSGKVVHINTSRKKRHEIISGLKPENNKDQNEKVKKFPKLRPLSQKIKRNFDYQKAS